jgi:hypothetical protein
MLLLSSARLQNDCNNNEGNYLDTLKSKLKLIVHGGFLFSPDAASACLSLALFALGSLDTCFF